MPADRGGVHDCGDLARTLHDYLDGGLGPGERRRLLAHIRDCVPCVRALGDLRELLRQLETLPMPAAPAAAREQIWEAICREAASGGAATPRRSRRERPAWDSKPGRAQRRKTPRRPRRS